MNLYPREPAHFWSAEDHAAVVKVVQRLQPRRVLEFGPGTSTLALLEGGAWRIDACEDDPHWLKTWQHRLRYKQVVFHSYLWAECISIPALDAERFDLALIDGPYEVEKRTSVIEYCMRHCAAVLVPLETSHGTLLERFVHSLECKAVNVMKTGPLAGAFALVTV